jgi:hypothetical protein
MTRSTQQLWLLFSMAIALVASALLPISAAAQHTAVVLEFEGRGAAAARRIVVGAIGDRVDVIDLERAERSARDQEVDLATPEGRGQVATSDGISLWVGGELTGRGRRARTTVIVYDADGEEIARERAGAPRGAAGRRQIERAALDAIDAGLTAVEERTEETREAEAAADREELAGLDDDDEDDDEDDDDDDDDEASSSELSFPLIEIVGGVGGRVRSADVQLAGASGVSRVYDATFAELALRITSHPLASDETLGGLFVTGDLAFALGLSSEDAMMNEIGTSALRFELGAGYLFGPLGILTIGGKLSFGYDDFSLDPNPVMPSSTYTYLRLGPQAEVAIVPNLFHVRLEGGLRIGLGTGDLAPFFGESASSFGFDLGLEARGHLDMGFVYIGRFSLHQYGLSFDGDGVGPDGMAMTGDDVTGDGGADLGITFMALLGYRME